MAHKSKKKSYPAKPGHPGMMMGKMVLPKTKARAAKRKS